MTAAGDIDRERLQRIKDREDAAFVAAPSSLPGDLGASQGLHAERRSDVVASDVVRPPAAVRGRGQGRAVPRRGRTRVLRLQHRGHVDVRRLRAGAGGRGDRAPRGAGHAVPPAQRRRAVGRRRARSPLRPAEVAVHAGRVAGEHRGDPCRPGAHRPRQGPVLRRQVPRPFRRSARGPAGRRAGARGGRSAARRHRQDRDRAVQRPGGAAPSAGAARSGDRDHRARAHEQRGVAPARARVPRRPPRDHARDGHRPGLRRDPHAGGRSGRAHEDVEPGARRRSRSGSRSRAACPWARTG